MLEKVISPFGEIFVFEDLWGRWMRVGGVSQSGGLVVNIWHKALGVVQKRRRREINNVLILGLGAGSAANLVSQRWPEAKITGIDIDPKVIEIGRKYFGLEKINNLEIIIGDAIEIIKKRGLKSKKEFDLILVDLYLGRRMAGGLGEKEFLIGLRDVLSEGGIVVFNCFNWGEYKERARELGEKVGKNFPFSWVKKAVSNILIFASLSEAKRI